MHYGFQHGIKVFRTTFLDWSCIIIFLSIPMQNQATKTENTEPPEPRPLRNMQIGNSITGQVVLDELDYDWARVAQNTFGRKFN